MLKNYFKIVLKNIKRHKGYSFINIAGLVTGMACFILMMLYVYHELSFDKFHENKNRIYRIAHQSPGNEYMGSDYYAVGPAPLAAALMDEAPEVDVATKFGFPRSILLGKGNHGFTIRVFYADENFFNVFSFRLIEGDKNTALAEPNCAVVSQDIVNKYFKGESPLGKTIFNIIKVTGVVENVPENSHIQFDCVISFVNLFSLEEREEALQNWRNSSYFTYVKLREGCDYQQFSKKVLSIVDKHYEFDRERNYFLQPLESIHLKSHINFEFSQNNDIKLIYLFMSIAFLILIIACINYMNLSTARASNRAKEIGVKKVIGAKRGQLFKQFTAESILITLVSLVLALGIVCLLLPSFSSFVERDINIDNLLDWRFLTGLAAVILITGLSAGLYPALFLSSFHPVNIIKGTTSRRSGKEWVRSALVVFQFCTTTILLSFGLIVYKQINFIRSENIGYERENIVVLRLSDGGVRKNLEAFKNEIKNDSRVLGMTASSGLPTTIESGSNGVYENEAGEEIRFHTHVFAADYDFLDVYRMEIVKGRDFSRKSGTDEENAVIVNETFVKKANWKNPIGKKVLTWMEGKTVGVVKDFHFHSFHLDIKPLVINCSPSHIYYASIRIRGGDIPGTLGSIKKTYEKFRTRYPFEYRFLDDVFNRMYKSEQKLGTLLGLFSILAVFVACLGLFGLALHSCERRTKEIGIRKVVGASVPQLLALLSGKFTNLVIIANILAWLPAYYFVKKWLQNFAYRADIGILTFVLAGAFTLFIALIAVSYQTIKAATDNPVDSLRYE